MTRFRKILLGSAAALAVGGAVFAFSGIGPQAGHVADAGMFSMISAASAHGMGGSGKRGGFGRMCGEQRSERLEKMIGFGEAFFKFEGDQRAAWTDLTTTLREASDEIGRQCDVAREKGRTTDPSERLARMEERLSTGLTLVRKVRPSFDRFYGTLDAEQKAALEKMMKHGGRHGHKREPESDTR